MEKTTKYAFFCRKERGCDLKAKQAQEKKKTSGPRNSSTGAQRKQKGREKKAERAECAGKSRTELTVRKEFTLEGRKKKNCRRGRFKRGFREKEEPAKPDKRAVTKKKIA